MPLSVRTRWLAAAGLLAGVVAVVLVAAPGGDADEAGAEQSAAPTVPLERRDLAERVSVEGALGYADESEVINRLSGTVTWLPREGEVVRRGARLLEIDDEPVVLMYGDLPAYRELAEGSSGADVKELEANLVELGFGDGGSITIDDEFTSATAAAVADWQESIGLDRTGAVELGRVVFQRGPRRVSSLDLALGSDTGSAGGGSGSDLGASSGSAGVQTVLASLASPKAADDGDEQDPSSGSKKPGGQPDAAGGTPAAGSGTTAGESAAGSSTAPESEASAVSTQVMTTTSVERVVTVELDPDQVPAAERGAVARVTVPGGEEVKGRISSVATVADAAAEGSDDDSTDSGSESATIEVTISLGEGAGASGLDQAPVDVELTEGVRRNVFAVPVEALIGTSGGEYAIVVADGSSRRRLEVDPGLFADGYVEIEGEGLSEGLAVEVPER